MEGQLPLHFNLLQTYIIYVISTSFIMRGHMQPSPSYTKIPQENIRGMLALFKAKATDQRFKFINIAKLTTDKNVKELCEFNISVLDKHISRCSKLTRSKTLVDLNTSNYNQRFMDMIIVGYYEGEKIEFNVKNMERIKPVKKLIVV